MTKLLKERTGSKWRVTKVYHFGPFPDRGERGLQNAERKPVYHRIPPILSFFLGRVLLVYAPRKIKTAAVSTPIPSIFNPEMKRLSFEIFPRITPRKNTESRIPATDE